MKKLLFVVLTALFCCAMAFAESSFEIVCGNGYIMSMHSTDVYALLDGEKVDAEWSVSDKYLMQINSEGRLKAYDVDAPMSCELTAVYGEYSAVRTITVVPEAKSVIVHYKGNMCGNERFDLTIGETISFEAVTIPASSAPTAVWSTSDEKVAVVDNNGNVTAIGAGEAKVYVTMPNGWYSHCIVKVSVPPQSVKLPEKIEIGVGRTQAIKTDIYPAEASDCALKYTSSDYSVCEVDQGGRVTGVSTGTAVIMCETANGLSASAQVEVYQPVYEINRKEYAVAIGVNESRALGFSVYPANAKYKTLKYSSSNEKVATVDENGVVTGISAGSCRISAETKDGVSAYTDVNVNYIRLNKIDLPSSFMTLGIGDSRKVNAVYTPSNASDRKSVYTSSDENVAYVRDGVLYASSKGRAVITVSCADCTDTMTVRVVDNDSLPLEGVKIGLNPGHQIDVNYTKYPLAPGSSEMGNANGGYAVGAVTYTKEYEVALNVGLYMRDMLEELGAEVVMTRTVNDAHIDNIERAELLNNAGVDFALQLHCNNNPTSSTSMGMSMFVKSSDYVSRDIADAILPVVCEVTGAYNLNVRWYDRYMSLNYSTTPAALIEMGYLSTPEEDLLLSDPDYQYKIARGITDGIVKYFKGE